MVFVFVWTFWLDTGVPLAFLTLLPAMWLALRYSTTVSTVFLLVAGAWIVYATLLDRGAFIVPDIQTRALLAQAMVVQPDGRRADPVAVPRLARAPDLATGGGA